MIARVSPIDALIRHITPTAPGDCWPWGGTRDDEGYGIVKFKGKMRKAHRLAYEAASGPIPAGLMIRHTCDNPPCCNPRHLLPGTALDNSNDKMTRGRHPIGDDSYQARLSEQDVPAIRQRYSAGATTTSLALEYGVSPGAIWLAATGRTWKHVEGVAS